MLKCIVDYDIFYILLREFGNFSNAGIGILYKELEGLSESTGNEVYFNISDINNRYLETDLSLYPIFTGAKIGEIRAVLINPYGYLKFKLIGRINDSENSILLERLLDNYENS